MMRCSKLSSGDKGGVSMLSLFHKRRNPVIGDRALLPGGQHPHPAPLWSWVSFHQRGQGKAVLSLSPEDTYCAFYTYYAFWQLWGHGGTPGLASHSAVTLQSPVEEPGVALMPPHCVLSPCPGASWRPPLSAFMVESDTFHCHSSDILYMVFRC